MDKRKDHGAVDKPSLEYVMTVAYKGIGCGWGVG